MTPTTVADGRNIALDGVRGLAARSVGIAHCVMSVAGRDVWAMTAADVPAMRSAQIVQRALLLLFPADPAVMVFFVLSGHVLWRSFARHRTVLSGLPDYLCARIFRLLPLVVVGTLLIAPFKQTSLPEVLANMLLLSTSLNGVMWSLQVEMVGSVVIFAVWVWSRDDVVKLLAALGVLAAAVPFFRGNFAVVYLPAFVLGALIRHVPAAIWRSRALCGSALAMLLLPSIVLSNGGVTRVFEIVAAMGVIGCVGVQQPAWLKMPIVHFLGAISYPFYLLHPLGLMAAFALAASFPATNYLSQILIYAVISVGITIPIAWFLHVTVEMPALRSRPRLGNKALGRPPAV